MAAASTSGGRTTRRTRGGEGEQVEKVYMTRTRWGRRRADRAVEVVDISGSSCDDKEEERGDKLVTVEEKNELVKLEEEEQLNLEEEEEKQVKLEEEDEEEEEDTWKGGFRTVVDFESDDSLANLTVKTFLRDCCLHPKILCHKQFKFVRDFMGEATGISFQLPVESPYLMDHEDDTICVDKGDDYLNDLKARLIRPDPNDYDEDDDEVEVPPHYWATITPHFKKSDLSLMVFKWVLEPMTPLFLEMYIRFCRAKYVPPKPPTPPPAPPKPTRRRKRKGGRRPKKKVNDSSPPGAEKVEVASTSSSPPNSKEDDGVDVYITDFVEMFDLSRNMDIEERLQGDIEAKRKRQEENKEEPKSSKELAYLMQANKKNFNTMSSYSTLNCGTNGWRTTDDSSLSDDASSSSSSGSSFNSEYRGKYTVGGLRRPYRRKVKKKVKYRNRTKTSIKAVAKLVVGESSKGKAVNKGEDKIKVNGDGGGEGAGAKTPTITISSGSSANGEAESGRGASGKSEAGSSSGSSTSGSINNTPTKKPPNGLIPRVTPSKSHKITCDICRPSKMFAGWKYLFRHMAKWHDSKKAELVTCKCGRKVRKEKYSFHQRYYCSKSLVNGGGN